MPDLLEIILKEVECRRHVLTRNETPKINLLALRYGVSAESIRQCNQLGTCSSIIEPGSRSFLYIPPHEVTHHYRLRRIRFCPKLTNCSLPLSSLTGWDGLPVSGRRSELINTALRVRRRTNSSFAWDIAYA